jgi:cell division protein FtsQ
VLNRRRNKRRRASEGKRWTLPALPWRALGLILGACAAVAVAGVGLVHLLDQPISSVRVDGSFQHLSALDVEKAVRANLHGAGLITVDLDRVRRGVSALPWVDVATVQRSWPRGLAVHVAEQVAVARWNAGDLVNARGQLFISEARYVPPELPQLSGPEGTAPEVVARYQAAQGRIVEAGMRLVALRLDTRGAWELLLDNGVTVRLGNRQVDERFERFATAALHLISQRATDIAYVDMRYSNGFAVGWRNAASHLAGSLLPKEAPPEA